MRVYLDELWPKSAIAQVPYLYPQSFIDLLNKVMAAEVKREAGRRYVEIE